MLNIPFKKKWKIKSNDAVCLLHFWNRSYQFICLFIYLFIYLFRGVITNAQSYILWRRVCWRLWRRRSWSTHYFCLLLWKETSTKTRYILNIMLTIKIVRTFSNGSDFVSEINKFHKRLFWFLLQVPEHRLRKTKETKDRKKKSKWKLIPRDQKYNAFRYMQIAPCYGFQISRVVPFWMIVMCMVTLLFQNKSSLIVNIMFNILKLNSCFSGGSL